MKVWIYFFAEDIKNLSPKTQNKDRNPTMADGVCIGIDFGESASRVALFDLTDKRLEPLCFPGLDNENNLPSIVSFTGKRVVVGRAHSRDTIFGILKSLL